MGLISNNSMWFGTEKNGVVTIIFSFTKGKSCDIWVPNFDLYSYSNNSFRKASDVRAGLFLALGLWPLDFQPPITHENWLKAPFAGSYVNYSWVWYLRLQDFSSTNVSLLKYSIYVVSFPPNCWSTSKSIRKGVCRYVSYFFYNNPKMLVKHINGGSNISIPHCPTRNQGQWGILMLVPCPRLVEIIGVSCRSSIYHLATHIYWHIWPYVYYLYVWIV